MVTDLVLALRSPVIMQRAQQLGFSHVLCAGYYDGKSSLPPLDAVIIKTSSAEELRRTIDAVHSRGKKIIVEADSDEINRTALESKKVWMLLNPGKGRTESILDFRNSGLNQVLCTLAAEKNILIGIAVPFIHQDRKQQAYDIAKIMQNIRLCRKYHAKLVFLSLAHDEKELCSAYDIKSLALSFGMTTEQVQECFLQ